MSKKGIQMYCSKTQVKKRALKCIIQNFCEKFQEWEKIIHFIKTEMNMSDMDKLIDTELMSLRK